MRPIPPAATSRRHATARLAFNWYRRLHRGRGRIAELARLPRGAERAAVLRTRILGKQGKHAEAIAHSTS